MSASSLSRSFVVYHLHAAPPRAAPSHDDVIYFTRTEARFSLLTADLPPPGEQSSRRCR